VRGYVVDVNFCVFDVSVEEFGAGFGFGLNEVDKLHKTDEAVIAKIANNPALAKALTDPNLTPTQKQQLAKELVSGVMLDLLCLCCSVGWCQYLGLGCLLHGWFHVLGWLPNLWCLANNPALAKALTDPNLTPTQKQQLAKELVSGVMLELGALLVLFCGLVSILGSWLSIAWLVSCPDTNNNNLGNTPAEIQRNTNLISNNNQDYARIDKSKGKDFVVTGTLTAAAIYAAIVGDGNPVDGLETIGQGNDPLTKVIAQGSQAAIELSYEHFPKATEKTLDLIAQVGNNKVCVSLYFCWCVA
jgi:hypothetical protein